LLKNVSAEGLSFGDHTIPITQENSHRISAAVAELRKRVEPPRVPVRPSSESGDSADVALLEIRLDYAIASLQELSSLDPQQRVDVADLIGKVRKEAARLGVV